MSRFKVGDVVIFKGSASLGRVDWQISPPYGIRYGHFYTISGVSLGSGLPSIHSPSYGEIYFNDDQLIYACGLAKVLYEVGDE